MASAARGRRDRQIDPRISTAFDDKPLPPRDTVDNFHSNPHQRPEQSSPQSPWSSPTKSRTLSPPYSPPLTCENLRALERQSPSRPPSVKTSSGGYMKKKGSPKKQNRKKPAEDPASHPLNLPPDELRRLSAAMSKHDNSRSSMDIDNASNEFGPLKSQEMDSQPTSPFNEAPGAFPTNANGAVNGVNGHTEKSPTPPPHRIPPKPPVDAEACKVTGNKFFKLKDYSRAIAEYSKAVDAEPANPTYLSNRAAAYISANKYDAALADSLHANQLDPTNDKILHRLARIYTSLGRPEDALDTYSKIPGGVSAKDTAAAKSAIQAIKSAENQINSAEGNANMALWSLDQAKQSLGFGLPWPRRWQILRAKAHLKNGSANSLGEVQGIVTALMRDNSTDAEAIVLAGRAFYLKDDKTKGGKSDYQRAEDCFRQALNLDPDMAEAREALKTMRRFERARNEANDVFKRGKYSEAVNLYSECLTIDPKNKITNAKVLLNRGLAKTKLKLFDEAVKDCEAALKLDPTYTKARKVKAKAVGDAGDWQKAVDELKTLAEENPGDKDVTKDLRHAELELKKSKRKDFYKILGVEKDAGEAEISRAYKKKALRCHPDKFQGDKAKEEEFKELTEANETLSDPEKRQRYDSGVDLMEPGEGMPGFPGGFGGFGGGGGGGVQIDPEMLFNMMGGMGEMGGAGGGRPGGMPGFSFSTGGGGRGGFPF